MNRRNHFKEPNFQGELLTEEAKTVWPGHQLLCLRTWRILDTGTHSPLPTPPTTYLPPPPPPLPPPPNSHQIPKPLPPLETNQTKTKNTLTMSHPSPTHLQSTPNTPQPQSSIPKKTVPLPWSHLETVNLIEAYQEKWYSLKRGQLKASQWEEVASAVAARCGFKELSKTATQCRHKMEKLRKRYRGEKQRGSPSAWNYFDMMDMMERGPFPLSARPIPLLPPLQPPSSSRRHGAKVSNSSDEEEDEEDMEEEVEDRNKSRSINHILRRQPPVASPIFDALPLPSKYVSSGGGGGGEGVSRFMRNPMFRKRKRSYENDIEEDEEEEDEEEEGDDGGGRLLSELAFVVRAFGEGFVKVENMKLEMMKETERQRTEMEKKRMEMIHESQRRIVDAIAKTYDLHYKSKKPQEKLAE